MSDSAQILVDIEVSEDGAEALGRKIIKHLIAKKIIVKEMTDCAAEGEGHEPGPGAIEVVEVTKKERDRAFDVTPNGVSVVVGRTVHHTIENGVELVCAKCKKKFEPGEKYHDAVAEWEEGEDAASFACEKCGHAIPVQEWDGPYVLGLGNLGVQFDNWPPLKTEFLQELQTVFGHRLRLVQQYM